MPFVCKKHDGSLELFCRIDQTFLDHAAHCPFQRMSINELEQMTEEHEQKIMIRHDNGLKTRGDAGGCRQR